jgi:hypothetical protein
MLALSPLAGDFTAGWALAGRLAGGVALLLVAYVGLAVGMTSMNFLEVLGTMFAPGGSKTTVYGIGLTVHLTMSAAFGVAHAGILHAIGVTTVGRAAGWDLFIGAAHGMVVLAVLPMALSLMHPLVRKHAWTHPASR